jgi:hypothetical protein
VTTILAFDVPPTSTDFNGGPAVFGNDFAAAAPGSITGIWYFHESSNEPVSVTALVHRQSNQQLISSKSTPTAGMTDEAYNLITLDTPLLYPTGGEILTVSVYWPSGGFSFSTGIGMRENEGLSINIGAIGRFKNAAVTEGDYPTQTFAELASPVGVEFTYSGTPEPVVGSWEQLLSITREAAEYRRLSRVTPPQACPNDGEPLQRIGSILHCPFDGWQWPRDGDGIK